MLPVSPVWTRENLERAKGFEPSTPTLARLCSTPELRPRSALPIQGRSPDCKRPGDRLDQSYQRLLITVRLVRASIILFV